MVKIHPHTHVDELIKTLLSHPTEISWVQKYNKRQWYLYIERWQHGVITVQRLSETLAVEDKVHVPYLRSDRVDLILQRYAQYAKPQ